MLITRLNSLPFGQVDYPLRWTFIVFVMFVKTLLKLWWTKVELCLTNQLVQEDLPDQPPTVPIIELLTQTEIVLGITPWKQDVSKHCLGC